MREFIMLNQMIYNGKNQQGQGEAIAVLDPASLQVITTFHSATVVQVDAAVATAQQAFLQWQNYSDQQVKQCLTAISADILSSRDELARLICLEQGKPLAVAQLEVDMAVYWLNVTNALEIPVLRQQDEHGKVMQTYHRPVGVVASITPWNWPLMIAVWHIIPALKAKNCVINKPSEYTPLSSILLVEIINRHLPAGVCNIVLGEGDVGAALTQHHGINKVTFTGSTVVGQQILSHSAQDLTPVILELGGNDAAIVLDDVDVATIAEKIFNAAFFNAGQTCACIKRLYVHVDVYDAMVEALVELADQQVLGHGLEPTTTMGPIQNIKHYHKVKTMLAAALEEGAVIANKSIATVPEEGYFIAPLILTNVKEQSDIFASEQFAPILPVVKFSDIDEVIQQSNATDYALGASIWTQDLNRASHLAKQMQAGTVWVNSHADVSPHAAFSGWKMSGLGSSFALDGLLQFTQKQVIHGLG